MNDTIRVVTYEAAPVSEEETVEAVRILGILLTECSPHRAAVLTAEITGLTVESLEAHAETMIKQ